MMMPSKTFSSAMRPARTVRLLQAGHVLREAGRERVRLHRALLVEAHGELFAELLVCKRLDVCPSPGGIAGVETDLVGFAEEAEEVGLGGLADDQHVLRRRREVASELEAAAAGQERRDQDHAADARA